MEMRKVRRKWTMHRVTTIMAVRRDGGCWIDVGSVGVEGDRVVVPGRGVKARKRRVLCYVSEVLLLACLGMREYMRKKQAHCMPI